MLHIVQSNRLEVLADALARSLSAEGASVFDTQTVIVQERGIARWLSFALAERMGVAANIAYPFPADTIWSLFTRVLPEVPRESPFDPAVLTWRFFKLLEHSSAAKHPRVMHALVHNDLQHRHELARRLAAVFDRYLIYRPQWIAAWGTGKRLGLGIDEEWQAALWRDLIGELPLALHEHPARRFFATLAQDAAARAALPRTVHLFAVQALPPMYMEVFAQLAEWMDLRLYALNPCREHWGEIVRARDMASHQALAEEEAYFEIGNSLLASAGRHGRAFFDALAELQGEEHEDYVENPHQSVLALLQNDILNLRERGASDPPLPFTAADSSLQVHVCHGAMREVEVLHDRLLDAFARDPSLRPGDVLVLVPRIEDYAPAIDAVFATAPAHRRLPYTIADRSLHSESLVIRGFFMLLQLQGTRLEAETALALLELPPIARRFGIVADDFPLLREWIRASGIRWGYDENTRVELSLPANREHSWGAGFDRLFLGYALPGEGRTLFDDILPYDDIEGSGAQLLGRLKSFIDALAQTAKELQQTRSLLQWKTWTERLLAQLFLVEEAEESQAQAIRSAGVALLTATRIAHFDGVVPRAVWRNEMEELLEALPRPSAFLGNGIAFAALRSLRAVPARFLAVLGLNDGAFPRNPPQSGFDLLPQNAQRGDRIPRDEDRYAFLEAVLAARETLYLSYTGRSQRDDSVLPPSPLLSELLATFKRSIIRESVVLEHPLQPFSRRYFDGLDERLFSYAEDYAEAGMAAQHRGMLSKPFVRDPLETEELGDPVIALEDLQAFLRNPARFFLRQRLGLRLAMEEEVLEEAEPFVFEGLAQWRLRDAILAHRLAGIALEESLRLARAAGLLPHAAMGDTLHAAIFADVEAVCAAVAAAGPLRREHVSLNLGVHMLAGTVEGVGDAHHIVWHSGKLGPKQLLHTWVRHLMLNAGGHALPSVLQGLKEKREFAPVGNAATHLEYLLDCMKTGLKEPLSFFPATSLAYAESLIAGKDPQQALNAALNTWENNFSQGGDESDADYALAFRGRDPFGPRFVEFAEAIWLPILQVSHAD